MAEKWKTQDSARTMTKKYNEAVEEINESIKWIAEQKSLSSTEGTAISIDNGLTNEDLDNLINQSVEWVDHNNNMSNTEKTLIDIDDGLTYEDLDELLGTT